MTRRVVAHVPILAQTTYPDLSRFKYISKIRRFGKSDVQVYSRITLCAEVSVQTKYKASPLAHFALNPKPRRSMYTTIKELGPKRPSLLWL